MKTKKSSEFKIGEITILNLDYYAINKIKLNNELNINCQPVAINSGNVWPKNGKLISKKAITISILPIVKPGMKPIEFVNFIEEKIYGELKLMH